MDSHLPRSTIRSPVGGPSTTVPAASGSDGRIYIVASGDGARGDRGWKSSAATGDLYLRNYVYERLGRSIPHLRPEFR
jgi:hypothetical protein